MSDRSFLEKAGNRIDRTVTWIEGVVSIGGGIALPIFAWAHRPLELRNFSETASAIIQGGWVLKPVFFYASFIVAVALVVHGVRKLQSLNKPRE